MSDAQKICRLRAALCRIQTMIGDLPSGIDEEAREDDPSPADMVAHLGGLIYQVCDRALNEESDDE